MIVTEPRFCGLRVTASLPSSERSSPSPRDARLVHSTVPGPRIGNVLTTSSRDNHTTKLVRNATVHLKLLTDSDHNVVCATVRTPGKFARNRKQRAASAHRSFVRRAIPSYTDRRERLICCQLAHVGRIRGHSRRKSVLFTDTLLRSAEGVMPGQIQ